MSAFQNYFVDTIKNQYADFEGRASRSQYWYFQLFSFIISMVLSTVGAVLAGVSDTLAMIPTGLSFIFSLALIIPSIGLAVRRLHDTGKSGWFLFLALIPLLGAIALLVFFCTDSTPGENEYGPNPKGIGGSQTFNEVIDR